MYTFTIVCMYFLSEPHWHIWHVLEPKDFTIICWHSEKMTKGGTVSIHSTRKMWCIKLLVPIFSCDTSAICMKSFVWNWYMSQSTNIKHGAWGKIQNELHIIYKVCIWRGNHAKNLGVGIWELRPSACLVCAYCLTGPTVSQGTRKLCIKTLLCSELPGDVRTESHW